MFNDKLGSQKMPHKKGPMHEELTITACSGTHDHSNSLFLPKSRVASQISQEYAEVNNKYKIDSLGYLNTFETYEFRNVFAPAYKNTISS